jgi:hypothetical protein
VKSAALKKVISASRRIDMAAFFPERLADFLERRCPPEKTHSIVLWSKDPRNLLEHRALRRCLAKYDQLFLHFTITGIQHSFLEPRIPKTDAAIKMLKRLEHLLAGPERIRVRFDPVVHLKMPDGSSYTNLPEFITVAEAANQAGVENVIVSWMENYPKVGARLMRKGIVPEPVSPEKWKHEWEWLLTQAKRIGVNLSGCCVPGLPVSRCVDGFLLSALHPKREQASTLKAKGQRPRCGCTESWDIGWYYPCPGGCLYCYARPLEETVPSYKSQVLR